MPEVTSENSGTKCLRFFASWWPNCPNPISTTAMTMIDASRLAAELRRQLGIRVRGVAGSDKDGLYVDLSPASVPLPEGFQVHVRLMWRTVDATVVLGNYARGMLSAMASSGTAGRALFEDIATDLMATGGRVALAING